MQPNASPRYDALSQLFHWITALAVVIAFVLGPEGFGRQMHEGLDPATRSDIVWHESLGLLVLGLTVARLLWVAVRPAAPTFEMAGWMQLTLWALLLALPATALLALGGEGHPLTLLGGVRIDEMPLIAGSRLAELADWGEVHGVLGDAILVLAGLHAVAAIYHHVVLKDGVLSSMRPGKG
jgi:cytochrome b561